MENIETYQNGELVEVRSIEIPIQTPPNIPDFINAMMRDAKYNQLVFSLGNPVLVSRLEIGISRLSLKEITLEDLQTIKEVWDTIISLSQLSDFTQNDLDVWNQIAVSNNIPFCFGNDFKMILSSYEN